MDQQQSVLKTIDQWQVIYCTLSIMYRNGSPTQHDVVMLVDKLISIFHMYPFEFKQAHWKHHAYIPVSNQQLFL